MAGLADDLGFLLSRASGFVVRATNTALAEQGLRVRAYSVLAIACDTVDGMSQRELAALLGLDPSQVVTLVDELVAAHLVARAASPHDRRAKLVSATDAGRIARARAAVLVQDSLQSSLTGLSEDEQATLRALLTRVAPEGTRR